MRGKEQDTLSEVQAGDIGAVAKLGDTGTGDTLAPKGSPVVVPTIEPPEPVLSIAILPKSKGDEDKLMTALHRLQDEDPSLRVRRNDETKQTLLSGMGETHLSIVTERLSRKFGVEVDTEAVRVPFRETISATAEAEGKYKKQTGGHGGQMITALVPTSEMLRYAIDLRSLTGGRGRFTIHHDHYDLLPAHLVDKLTKVAAESK